MKNLFYKLPQNIIDLFKGRNLLWQGIMIVLTYIIVVSGFDWYYFHTFGVKSFNFYITPVLILGTFLPVFLPLALLALRKTNTAWALGQAALLGWFLSSTYKVFTGRIPPEIGESFSDISHGFQFGFLRGGVFWGWPSSHTTVAFAMVLALITLYPKNKTIKIISLIYALYIGIAVSVSVHWFSEFISGLILGSIIGVVVGKSFRNKEYI